MKEKYLITGADGQLAREFAKKFSDNKIDFVAFNRNDLDITQQDVVKTAIEAHSPTVVFNCAAYNAVNEAEEDYETAYEVNAVGVKNLAIVCKQINALLVHYGTDIVFDGEKETPYLEDDATSPVNKYGLSKLEGEKLLMSESDNYLLLRVSWVFGPGEKFDQK